MGCAHNRLRFGSGGYYIFCAEPKCNAMWVAIKSGPGSKGDTDLDHDRGTQGLTTDRVTAPWEG